MKSASCCCFFLTAADIIKRIGTYVRAVVYRHPNPLRKKSLADFFRGEGDVCTQANESVSEEQAASDSKGKERRVLCYFRDKKERIGRNILNYKQMTTVAHDLMGVNFGFRIIH